MIRYFNDGDEEFHNPRQSALRLAFEPLPKLDFQGQQQALQGRPAPPQSGPRAISASPQGIDFIKGFEHLKNEVYTDDGANKPTIGWGHLVKPYEHFDYGITDDEAQRLLEDEIQKAANLVQRSVKVPLSQQQQDALISLAYNNPIAFKEGSSLMTALNGGDYAGAGEAFQNFAAAGGRHSPGLEKRRIKEQGMFSNGVYDSSH